MLELIMHNNFRMVLCKRKMILTCIGQSKLRFVLGYDLPVYKWKGCMTMLVKTKHFGEIDLDEDKIIEFENGIMGFEDYKKYTILYDTETGEKQDISWLQSLDEPALAIPVANPFIIKADYNPQVEDELLKPLGNLTEENVVVLVSITVPENIEKISANLKAPFIINSDERKGAQIIVENADYEIKYCFYEQLKAYKAAKEGK
jgi:flagellar assembly factor FliW